MVKYIVHMIVNIILDIGIYENYNIHSQKKNEEDDH